jgi:hypothetical protein
MTKVYTVLLEVQVEAPSYNAACDIVYAAALGGNGFCAELSDRLDRLDMVTAGKFPYHTFNIKSATDES